MTENDMSRGPRVVVLPDVPTMVVRATVSGDELRGFFDRSFAALGEALEQQQATAAGPAFAYYPEQPGERFELEVGFPVERPVPDGNDVIGSHLPGGRAATLEHRGGYDELGRSWGRLQEWVEQQGLAPASGFWEVYLTEPTPDGDPAANRTALYIPLRA